MHHEHLLKMLQAANSSPRWALPSPTGLLSKEIPSSSISTTNSDVVGPELKDSKKNTRNRENYFVKLFSML